MRVGREAGGRKREGDTFKFVKIISLSSWYLPVEANSLIMSKSSLFLFASSSTEVRGEGVDERRRWRTRRTREAAKDYEGRRARR
jgi:hypothetical protein